MLRIDVVISSHLDIALRCDVRLALGVALSAKFIVSELHTIFHFFV